ncbi:helix-turn-helix transcriptional regulator [Nocardiopsis dassonvillei]|uniref:helix-turn-helix transcriptional regulator n=1 Tax=Nocardiopsis dassonvillei TaxID=2014 RepID=UPI0008FC3727|nr:transcriptional regulator [Nocardiopsis dassonvillei]APC36965.1 transcriptional regulator [Nocardiopsis dassonvillei]
MADTSARMLRLLSLLQTGRSWPGADLAAALEVSPRSLRRDIDRLRELGYAVESLRGPGGHYRLAAGRAVPPLLLEDDEVVAAALGLRIVAAGLGGVEGVEESAERALARLGRVLPSRLARRAKAMAAAVEPEQRVWPGVRTRVLTDLGEAVADGHWVRMLHRGGDGRELRRKVDPYRLVLTGRRWYLFAWDRERDDWRTFRLDRITGVTPTRAPFTRRELPGEPLAEHLERGFGAGRARHTVSVLFDASAGEVAARISRIDGDLEAVGPDRARYTARVDSHEWLAVVLALTGLPFTVEGPPEFARHTAALADRLHRSVDTTG